MMAEAFMRQSLTYGVLHSEQLKKTARRKNRHPHRSQVNR